MELFIFKMHYDQFFINCGAGEKGDNFLVGSQESWPAAPQWLGFAGVNCYRASSCIPGICSGTFLLSHVFTFWHICTNLSAECRTTQIREANAIHKSISTNPRATKGTSRVLFPYLKHHNAWDTPQRPYFIMQQIIKHSEVILTKLQLSMPNI